MISTDTTAISLMKKDWLFFCAPLKKIRARELEKIAVVLADSLRNEPRQKIAHALENPQVLATRKFLKGLKMSTPGIEECRHQLLATKLGIDREVFDHNPDFEKFAEKTHIERYLMEYDHTLQVDASSKKLSLLVEGQFMEWEKARKILADSSFAKTAGPSLPWQYGMNGLQNEDMYKWTELKPFKKGDPAEWGHQYIFEFSVCCLESPRLTGDHSWIRLKTPTGDIYSVGLYREDKGGGIGFFESPMKIKKGSLMQPDVSEFYPDPIHTIPFAITEEQFFSMKHAIEEDKKNDSESFQVLQQNCVIYTKKIASLAGIELPSSTISVYRLFMPKGLNSVIDVLSNLLPDLIVKISSAIYTVFMNLVQLMFGASIIDSSLKNYQNCVPHIASLKDIFNSDKLELHHPNSLARVTRKLVLESREKQIAQLEKQKLIDNCDQITINRQIEEVRYGLPQFA